MHAGEFLAILFYEVILLGLETQGCGLVAARSLRDHPQWAECVHRVPLPTSRRPVGWRPSPPPRAKRGGTWSEGGVCASPFLPNAVEKRLRASSWPEGSYSGPPRPRAPGPS